MTGTHRRQILFESVGYDKNGKKQIKDYMLGINDAAPLFFPEIIARAALDRAEKSIAKALKLQQNDKGMALYNANKALKELTKVDSEKAPLEFKQAIRLKSKAKHIAEDIKESLAANGETIYKNTALPKYAVDYHLKQGHILFHRKYWLKPDQLCSTCKTSGWITCPVCHGSGQTKEECPYCDDGWIECPICQGTGYRQCNECGGSGYIYIRTSGTSVVASFGGTGRYGAYNPYYQPPKIYAQNGYIYMQPGYSYAPCYTGPSISIGRTPRTEREICPKCNGTGMLRCPEKVKCPKCKGKGYFIVTCKACDGKGKIVCPECEGEGFTGTPQPTPPKKD